jgi:hypothetical protein
VTEVEWLACGDPNEMLEFLRKWGLLSDRKARLYACACCRLVWHLLADERSRKAVECAEQLADGNVRGRAMAGVQSAALWHHLATEPSRQSVVVAEQFADGAATPQQLLRAH